MKIYNRLRQSIACAVLVVCVQATLKAQTNTPRLVDPRLSVRAAATNLAQPTSMAFLGPNDFLVLEKASGKVQRIVNGTLQSTVLDLAVNSGSERGLLGIALHPDFPADPGVYLFWTESSTGVDTAELAQTPLLGNRVDRFRWNGSTLELDENIIRLRALQEDANQPARGNHDGGVLRFGHDEKLYIYMGDNGRRGQMQNLPDGPGPGGNMPDDQFGGPEPDNAHLTGVILRLNDDGTIPRDNPFFRAGALRGGEAGTNIQKVFAFGIRNGFGMAFDPFSGRLWEAQNGDDSFTEINRVDAGANLGWIQVMGPLSRIEQFKSIETNTNFFGTNFFGLQQVRWSPTNIADSASEALARMFKIFEGGNRFGAVLTGREEVPAVQTSARALSMFQLNSDGSLSYKLVATARIEDATMAHIHLGARGQNGPVVLFLLHPEDGDDFDAGDVIAEGRVDDTDVIARPGFTPTISNLVERIRQGRAYVNLHTVVNPGGEIRGQAIVMDRAPVSRYSDPEFSWKYEVAPAGVGFINSRKLGSRYRGDMIVGAARDFLQGGTLFRFNLSGNRRALSFSDRRLRDRVADNLAKWEITESESLLFGTDFGVGTDVQTGPNGNLYVVSLSHGTVYEIFSLQSVRDRDRDRDRDNDDHDDDDDNDDGDHDGDRRGGHDDDDDRRGSNSGRH